MMSACCPLHIDGPSGTCCDEDDCGPCCEKCPTCPTLHNQRGAGGGMYARRRSERGATGILSSILVVLGILVALRLVGFDAIGYVRVAVDWGADTAREIIDYLGAHS